MASVTICIQYYIFFSNRIFKTFSLQYILKLHAHHMRTNLNIFSMFYILSYYDYITVPIDLNNQYKS